MAASRHTRSVVFSVRFGSVRFGSGWLGTVRFGSVRFGSVRFGAVRFGSVRFGSVRCTFVYFGVLQCGVVRCGTMYRIGADQCESIQVGSARVKSSLTAGTMRFGGGMRHLAITRRYNFFYVGYLCFSFVVVGQGTATSLFVSRKAHAHSTPRRSPLCFRRRCCLLLNVKPDNECKRPCDAIY